jgi:hypothetical protein
LELGNGRLTILDHDGLREAGEFDPRYLLETRDGK